MAEGLRSTHWSRVPVTIVQPPMTSLQDDVQTTRRILGLQDGHFDPRRTQLWRNGDHGGG